MKLARVAFASLFCLGFAKCSSGPKTLTDGGPPESVAGRVEIARLWERELPGLLSDLSAADPGKGWVASSLPDPDRSGGEKKAQIVRIAADGSFSWKTPITKRVRSLAISPDGARVAYSTYEGELTLLDSQGGQSWAVTASCSPRFLAPPKQLACWHDDDGAPAHGFEIRSVESGARAYEYKLQDDLLAFELSTDRASAALSIAGGEARLVRFANGKPPVTVRTWKPGGEIAALAISGKRVAAVVQPRLDRVRANQDLKIFDESADAPVFSKAVPVHVDQAQIDGDAVLLHGSSPQGQAIFSLPSKAGIANREWSFQVDAQADYVPALRVAGGMAFAGFEEKGKIALSVRDGAGVKVAEFPLALVGGAYLYSAQEEAGGSVLLLLATDGGKLTAYRLRLK